MDIVLNRQGGVSIRDQLVTQIELKILGGSLTPGQKLPSVRALARRLKVHPNTISAAYQYLVADGLLTVQRGSGVFVHGRGPLGIQEASGLDDMIRVALHTALRKGFTGEQIRAAVERWLAAAPPDRVVVVDPYPEMGELIVHEVKQALEGVAVSCCTVADVERDPSVLGGAVALVLPYHVETMRRIAPGAALAVMNLEMSAGDREAVRSLPAGAIVLVVSHSPTVLPVAEVMIKSLRGDDLLVETRLVSATREWRRLASAADIVFADALAVEAVRKAQPRRVREVRITTEAALSRLRRLITVIVPR